MVKRGIFCIMARWAPHSDVGANMAMTRCQVNVNIDEFGWVNVNDLLSSEPWLDRNDEIWPWLVEDTWWATKEILGGTTEDKTLSQFIKRNCTGWYRSLSVYHKKVLCCITKRFHMFWIIVSLLCFSQLQRPQRLLAMINESNVQKTRYEMEDDPNVPRLWKASQDWNLILALPFSEKCRHDITDITTPLAEDFQGGKRVRAISKSHCLSEMVATESSYLSFWLVVDIPDIPSVKSNSQWRFGLTQADVTSMRGNWGSSMPKSMHRTNTQQVVDDIRLVTTLPSKEGTSRKGEEARWRLLLEFFWSLHKERHLRITAVTLALECGKYNIKSTAVVRSERSWTTWAWSAWSLIHLQPTGLFASQVFLVWQV